MTTDFPEGLIVATGGGAGIRIRVQPRASRNELVGISEGVLRLRLTSPPVEGAANEACIGFLADILDIPRRRVRIASGEKSRRKTVHVEGMTAAALADAIARALQGA